jgi:hypothetical protein
MMKAQIWPFIDQEHLPKNKESCKSDKYFY